MPVDLRSYYEKRAESELKLAQKAEHPAAVKAHYELATMYLNALHPEKNGRSNRS